MSLVSRTRLGEQPATTSSPSFVVRSLFESYSQYSLSLEMRVTLQQLSLAAASLHSVHASAFCQTQSQPNPIVNEYPDDVTGTINGTTAIVPIPYDVARSIIPSQYGILRAAFEQLIPGFPQDMYPALYVGVLDHDVQAMGIKIPDFQRVALRFPFVDRLNDGYSCFQYTAPQLLSFDNVVALAGSASYGATYPGSFDPPCDGYAGDDRGATYLSAYNVPPGQLLGAAPAIEGRFETVGSIPYDLKL
jgi:hypothetical protein